MVRRHARLLVQTALLLCLLGFISRLCGGNITLFFYSHPVDSTSTATTTDSHNHDSHQRPSPASITDDYSNFFVEQQNASEPHETKPSEPPPYLVIIDGLIYMLQLGQPKGISVVWKSLIPHLVQEFPPPSKVVFIDRNGNGLSNEISKFPGVTGAMFIENSLDASVRAIIKQHLTPGLHRMIPVFFSTYYDYPWSVEGLCKIIMYHDLIPENVGMYAGPGSEYYPRIEALARINSVVTVSDSTAEDLIRLYDKDLHLSPSDPAFRLLNGTDIAKNFATAEDGWFKFGWDRIITPIYNRISRNVFPGPSESVDIKRFRQRVNVFAMDQPAPFHRDDVPIDYFLTVGSDHPYKNFDYLMAAIDQLDDSILNRTQFVMIGRGGFKDSDRGQIHRHRVVFRDGSGGDQNWSPEGQYLSPVPIRLVFQGFIEEEMLKHAYSGAMALVYISSYEGFGLPLAEAMTSGTLAVTTNSSSLPEVGGPPSITAYVQDPHNLGQIAAAITQIATMTPEERQERVRLARKQVERFGGGGEEGIRHGWNEMGSLVAKHVRDRRKHRGRECFYN